MTGNMRSVTIAFIVMISSMAFAQSQNEAGQPSAPSAQTAPAVTQEGAKMTKKEAKALCKTEGKKGKDLKECIKAKSM
ncbi:MAG: hypothetical protein ACK5P7_00935 [Bdellovibrio sp.]|jgi:hypothetical protein